MPAQSKLIKVKRSKTMESKITYECKICGKVSDQKSHS